jgi:predicted O-linked N-acetylglucosamine transferase (SPINDLY family)
MPARSDAGNTTNHSSPRLRAPWVCHNDAAPAAHDACSTNECHLVDENGRISRLKPATRRNPYTTHGIQGTDPIPLVAGQNPAGEEPAAAGEVGAAANPRGDYAGAEECFRHATALSPNHAAAHYGLGSSLLAQKKFTDAADSFKTALRLNPSHPEALIDLGYALQAAGNLDEAIDAYSRLLKLNPGQFTAHYNLGLVFKDKKRYTDAESSFRAALALDPRSAETHNSLGFVLKEQGRLQEAEQSLRAALDLNPKYVEAHQNLGSTLLSMFRFCAAEDSFRAVLQLSPNHPDALNSLGSVLLAKGDVEEAEACYRSALRGPSLHPSAHSNLLMTLHYRDNSSAQYSFDEHRRWGKENTPNHIDEVAFSNTVDPRRRLRVGYVSADFCIHSVTNFLLPLLVNHSAEQVEIVCYSNTERQDEVTERLQKLASLWRDIRSLSDDEAVRLIRADQIDILVDLSGHTGRNRLRVFGRRVAPLQLTYLGYPDTSGLSTMDYRLTDAWADPPGSEAFHTEKLLRLPGGFLCYAPLFDAPLTSAPPLHANGFVTFGSFNNLAKMNTGVLRCWAEILQAVPGARLLLKTKSFFDPSLMDYFQARLSACGIAREAVELRPYAIHPRDHLMHYRDVDIALDTFPYNGTTTTCEAMWMGVPVITLAGEIHAGRVGASLLSSLGLGEWIARNTGDYVALAARLARDGERLTELRATLRQRMQQSRLCDGKAFAREVEQAYRAVWREWCEAREA